MTDPDFGEGTHFIEGVAVCGEGTHFKDGVTVRGEGTHFSEGPPLSVGTHFAEGVSVCGKELIFAVGLHWILSIGELMMAARRIQTSVLRCCVMKAGLTN